MQEQNFNQPSNLIVSGNMEAVFGESVTIFGETASFFQVDGKLLRSTRTSSALSAKVLFGAVTSGTSTTGAAGLGLGHDGPGLGR